MAEGRKQQKSYIEFLNLSEVDVLNECKYFPLNKKFMEIRLWE